MTFENRHHSIVKLDDENARDNFIIRIASNGKKYVDRKSVTARYCHISDGNDKTGKWVINFNFPIEYTCDHRCECYKKGLCYAENGCYCFAVNQARYSENYNYFMAATDAEMIATFQAAILEFGYSKFRYFTCGDIPNGRFFRIMIEVARNNPTVEFWSYTKKYHIVNAWIDENGALPANLKVVFSHWMNSDGSFFPMHNPHNLPTSEFIPFGMEDLIDENTHVCPCSDPTVKATCATCDHPCYRLQNGEKMALLEHSTAATKERDKALRTAKKAL